MKVQWDELYGEPIMEYFATPHEARDPRDGSYMRNHHAFTRYIPDQVPGFFLANSKRTSSGWLQSDAINVAINC